jgi:uncharacterized beta-barrel protein YwiB (DUF1934 family)
MMSQIQYQKRKTVLIEASYTHSINNAVFTTEEVLEGSLFEVDGGETFLLAFDSEVAGKRVTNTVKYGRGCLTRVQIGDVHTRQHFAQGDWYACQQFSEGRLLLLRTYTNRLDVAFEDGEGGLIELLYELWSGDSFLGHHHIEFFIS